MIFTGNLRIQMFENSKEAKGKLERLRTILGEMYKITVTEQS